MKSTTNWKERRIVLPCVHTWTKSYLINLHCVYISVHNIYIYKYIHKKISISIVALFRWLVVIWRKDLSHGRVSIVRRYFFNLLFHLRSVEKEKNENKIDVLSEEPCPLRRGGATGRANRLMMCDDRDDDAHDGPALRSSGTRLVVWGVPGETERAAWHWGTPTTTYLPSCYYSRAVIRGESRWNPSDVGLLCVLRSSSSWSLGESEREKQREIRSPLPMTYSTVYPSGRQTFYAKQPFHQPKKKYISLLFSPYCKPIWS